MSENKQKQFNKREVTGFKRVCQRLFSGAKLDAKLFDAIESYGSDTREGVSNILELISIGANVNASNRMGNTPLILACELNKFNLAIEFVKNEKTDFSCSNFIGYTALHCSVKNGNLSIIRLLLNANDERVNSMINKQDQNGNTALHLAVESGNTEIVDFLLKRGANKFIENNNRLIPIDVARKKGHIEMVRLFQQQLR